jgi:hypothetical protein
MIIGFIPAIIISLLGFRFGDGSGNESGMAHFFACASIIGLVFLISAIVTVLVLVLH